MVAGAPGSGPQAPGLLDPKPWSLGLKSLPICARISREGTKLLRSLALGSAAGLIDVLPMIPLRASQSAIASAFAHWVVLGFIIAHLQLSIPGWAKGLVVALVSAVPIAILVAPSDPGALAPIAVTSAVLGAGVGHLSGKG